MQTIITLTMLSIYNSNPSKLFLDLICNYELNTINIEIDRKELINGFKKINNCTCLEDSGVVSIIFLRNGQIEKFEKQNFNSIFKLFKSVKKGEIIEMTITETKPILNRKNKLIKIKASR